MVFSLPVMFASIVAVQLEVYRRQQKLIQQSREEQRFNYKQIEALFSMFAMLEIDQPLPPMREAAIAPDFANVVISLIQESKPQLIVEAGSGVSTLVAAYCLKQMGSGMILSLEQEENYAELTSRNLIRHGLQDFAKVIYAPLKQVVIDGEEWYWYDAEELSDIQSIDMLVVDGPIQFGQSRRLLRYPALPVLFESLSNEAIVVLDDGYREDERQVASLWQQKFNCFDSEILNCEKGAIVLRRKPD